VVLLSMLEEWHAVYFLLLKRWNEQQMNCIVSEVNMVHQLYAYYFTFIVQNLFKKGSVLILS
jgi:hypothetical protein